MPSSAVRTSVLLVDEEVVVRAGLRLLINSWPTLQVIGEANTPAEALATMGKVRPNLIVCSCAQAVDAFLDDLRVVVERAEETPVVVLASSRSPQVGATAMRAGAKCVISKKGTALELRATLERLGVRKNGSSRSRAENQSRNGSDGDCAPRLKART